MQTGPLHRFEFDSRRFAIDTETCFCFECDPVSWDVLEHYPHTNANRIYHLLSDRYDPRELKEVVGELEWLRATGSILPEPKPADALKRLQAEPGLKNLTVRLQAGPPAPPRGRFTKPAQRSSQSEIGDRAITFLLSRAAAGAELALDWSLTPVFDDWNALDLLCNRAANAATLAGKQLALSVTLESATVRGGPPAIARHRLRATFPLPGSGPFTGPLRVISKSRDCSLDRWAAALAEIENAETGTLVIEPDGTSFGESLTALSEAGFRRVAYDLEHAFFANPALDLDALLATLTDLAQSYAGLLLKHEYLRCDPFAGIFWRVFRGQPIHRIDPSGESALFVDADGSLYPCRTLAGIPEFRAGSLIDQSIDDAALAPWDDLGVDTTPQCIRCWARHLCGGGAGAVHYAYSKAINRPADHWCAFQRNFLHAAVAAFNRLSSAGVDFDRMYRALGRAAKPSLFALAKAAFRMHIGLRPLAESDAALLARWESWSDSAYFLLSERSVRLGNAYERELDATHPRQNEQEFVLLRKNATPFGLLKVRPDREPGLFEAFIYFRREPDYAGTDMRRSFRTILKEAGTERQIRTLLVPAAPWEEELKAFLAAVGFEPAGVQREAIYSHGKYSGAEWFAVRPDAL